MSRFTSAINLAERLIKKNGQEVILQSTSLPPDGAMPWRPDKNKATSSVITAVFLNYAQNLIDGEMIRNSDQQVLVAAKDTVPPKVSDTIVRDDEVWAIVAVKILNPNGEKILYDLQVRK